jgi:hypothetical protein
MDRGRFGAPDLRFRASGSVDFAAVKPAKFEHNRYLGDKRKLVVHDLDMYGSDDEVTAAIDELMESERFQTFGPDTLTEARNRCYKPDKAIRRQLAAADDSA